MDVVNKPAPDEIDAALNLLDRQIVDKDGRMAGTVDDLELTEEPNGAPYVTAILAGPGALSRQLGGRVGRWLESVHERLHPAETSPEDKGAIYDRQGGDNIPQDPRPHQHGYNQHVWPEQQSHRPGPSQYPSHTSYSPEQQHGFYPTSSYVA